LKPFLHAALAGLVLVGGWGFADVAGLLQDPVHCAACLLLLAFLVLTHLLRTSPPAVAGVSPPCFWPGEGSLQLSFALESRSRTAGMRSLP
jgi:hypothetical protein